MSGPSWSVVCTANEPLPLLCAFAAHHLGPGACEVHIHLDNPRPGHREMFETIDRVFFTACDQRYWRGRNRRTVEIRQSHNAFDAYSKTETDWLCDIDSDEFLAPPEGRSVADELAAQTDDTDFLVLPMRERA